jgi:hypothetical protein
MSRRGRDSRLLAIWLGLHPFVAVYVFRIWRVSAPDEAREVVVQPGVLVFRLRDQTPSATEVLGTLQVRPNSSPAAIASFSLRAVPPPRQDATTGASPLSAASPR